MCSPSRGGAQSARLHPSTEVNKAKFERVHKRALRFVNGRHIPEQGKTQQLRYNDLTFFRKCLDGDTDMEAMAMARITTGRIMRNSNGETHAPKSAHRPRDPLVLFPTRHPVEFPPFRAQILSCVPFPKNVPQLCDV
jgi:hypothetical protein